jgi:nucleoside-diphosphate-sugar epimerase
MITVLGASGFIGSRIVKRLATLGQEHRAVRRDDALPAGSLGHVIYCIGLTADFRSRPLDTVEAHVCKLLEVLRTCEFESLLYLSSTRLYSAADSTSEETAIRIAPLDGSDLYNASKAMGESLVLNCGRAMGRVARISNVYGSDFDSDNFLSSIIRDAIVNKAIVFQTSAESAKDYISVAKVVDTLIEIATNGSERIYNLASGNNVSNGELANKLRALTGCTIQFSEPAPFVTFPPINIDRLRADFAFQPSHLLDDLPQLIDLYRHNLESSHDQS